MAVVSADGVVTGVHEGKTIVTASKGDAVASVDVYVSALIR